MHTQLLSVCSLFLISKTSVIIQFNFNIFKILRVFRVLIFDLFLLQNKVTEYIALDPLVNKTGCVWHVFLKGDFKDVLYGYKFDGKFSPQQGHYYDSSRVLLDPYAKVSLTRKPHR